LNKKKTTEVARYSENFDKNRWANILPYDDTRVILTPIPDVEGSDYINGNWISDLQGDKKAYICTQGPLSHTIGDFWRMVFEYKVSVIVMLTKLFEDDKEKCAQYWPDDLINVTYDNVIDVHFFSEESSPTIVTRKFRINMNNEDREVTQMQFTAWPDHGLPTPEEDYIALSDKSDETNLCHGPILVHCSAGVGRSGTFCAVHSYIHFLRDHFHTNHELPSISIANSIVSLRKERPGMVQTGEQYEFCYRAIYKEFEKLEEELQKLQNGDIQNNNPSPTDGDITDNSPTITIEEPNNSEILQQPHNTYNNPSTTEEPNNSEILQQQSHTQNNATATASDSDS